MCLSDQTVLSRLKALHLSHRSIDVVLGSSTVRLVYYSYESCKGAVRVLLKALEDGCFLKVIVSDDNKIPECASAWLCEVF